MAEKQKVLVIRVYAIEGVDLPDANEVMDAIDQLCGCMADDGQPCTIGPYSFQVVEEDVPE